MMFLEQHLRSSNLSDNTSGFVWEQLNVFMCDDFKGSSITWAVCSMLCFAFGFPACIAILWDMFKMCSRGTPLKPNSFLILNLTIMDAVFLSFIPAGIFNYFIWKNSILGVICGVIYALNVCGRPLLMACICLDCHLAVVHPIIYHKTKHLTPRVVMVAVVWTFTGAYGIASLFFYWINSPIFFTLPFTIAMIIIGTCDSFIFYTLYKSDPGRKNIHPQKKRAVQTIINSLVMSMLSYLPQVLLIVCGTSLSSDLNTYVCTIVIPSNITLTMGSALMPLLHLNNNGKLDCFKLGDAGTLNSYKIRCCRGQD